MDSAAGFSDYIEYLIEAEALGYHSSFIVEHHFTGFGQVSATLNLLSWIGAQTTTLRLGTAVMVLPWHNPVLLAEQAATLDLLSGGRLDFGIGKGYRHNEFVGFRIPMEQAEDRFNESIDIITKSWTSDERFSFHGKYWQYDDIIVEPPTSQKPHPPFWQGAGSQGSLRKVAARGHNLLLDQFASMEETLTASTPTRPPCSPTATASTPPRSPSPGPSSSPTPRNRRPKRSPPYDGATPPARGQPNARQQQQSQHHGLFRYV